MPRLKILLALDWYDYRIHRGVARIASQQGWDLVCNHSHASQPLIPKGWIGDGVISLIGNMKTAKQLANLKCPIIDLGLLDHGEEFIRVVVDNTKIGKLGAEHILDRGFKSVWVERPQKRVHMFNERYLALKETMETHGGKVNILERKDRLLKAIQKAPQAVMGWVDEIAIQWMDKVIEAGFSIPENCIFLGVDDHELTCFSREIPLSSIRSDQEGLGERAAKLLQKHIIGSGSHQMVRHQPIGIAVRKSTDTFTSTHDTVKQALEWIDDNISKRINASQLASALNLTPQGLQMIFRSHFHMSPAQAIRYYRIQRVKQALIKGQKLRQISDKCGYVSPDALCRHFRTDVGLSPGQWRKTHVLSKSW